jgi:hypothetical protein
LASPVTSMRKQKRRETFSPRETFAADDRPPPARRSSAKMERERPRSRSRARSVDFASDGETDIRESMPHKREKDKAWWEGRR